jgi:hypothetical protein
MIISAVFSKGTSVEIASDFLIPCFGFVASRIINETKTPGDLTRRITHFPRDQEV